MTIRATHSYAERGELAADLAWHIANQLVGAVEERGKALLAVSGGGTPKLLFSVLAEAPLPWEAITITLVDDRCVAPNHEHSNVALITEFLMQGEAEAASLAPLFDPEKTPQQCAQALTSRWQAPDVLILGMGGDGHTASLFPHSPQLGEGLSATQPGFIQAEPTLDPLVTRLTMNKAAIDQAVFTVLHIEGGGKREVFERAKQPDADPMDSPISAFLNDMNSEIEVYWAP